ncbi:hypothetical protein VTN00DRAFT_9367 [Thermoascus crustaceus]|uniref:uncharacterized protein n=1 Tax=Thermoascus crustaceus TaxID=5088 RepID=UPI00374269A3
MSFYFASVNRNRRSATLDLKRKEALDILYRLAKDSDVLVENFMPGKADELGIGYDTPVAGYGSRGPYSNRAGYDAIAAAEGGLMHITGKRDGPPVRPGLGMVDMYTGLYMHGATPAALEARRRTGRGQKLDASSFETQISLLINVGVNWFNLGLEGQRFGSAHPSIVPYNTYQTRDHAHLALGANNDRQFKVLAERIGRVDLLDDPRFRTNELRVENRTLLDGIVNAVIKERTVDEWIVALEGSGLAHGPVNTIEKDFAHPQATAGRMIECGP